LQQTIAVDNVTTYLCFDSRFVIAALSFMKKVGLLRFLPIRLSTEMLKSITIGKPVFRVKVAATGIKAGHPIELETDLYGEEEAKITALVTIWAAHYMMYEHNSRKGVFHMEEVLDWSALQEELKHNIVWEAPNFN